VIVFSAIKSTDVYKEALERAKADPAVIEALGSPIKDGFLVSGNNRRGPIRPNNPRLSSAGTTIKLRYNLDCQDQ